MSYRVRVTGEITQLAQRADAVLSMQGVTIRPTTVPPKAKSGWGIFLSTPLPLEPWRGDGSYVPTIPRQAPPPARTQFAWV